MTFAVSSYASPVFGKMFPPAEMMFSLPAWP